MMDRHVLSNGTLSAAVKADGAELCSLRDATGEEMLWQAGPIWPRHAPVLFPIVGRLKDDTLRHQGRSYHLPQHGFARDKRFAWLNRSATTCRLVLHEDTGTRAVFPFAFRLEIAFTLDDDALETSFTVANPGRDILPASVGAHPGFVWPLVEGLEKSAHVLEFAEPETAPVRRLAGGLLSPEPEASPIIGETLALDPALFATDAIILDNPASDARCAIRRLAHRWWRWRGTASSNSASGRAKAAISCVSNPGMARTARRISTASSATSRA